MKPISHDSSRRLRSFLELLIVSYCLLCNIQPLQQLFNNTGSVQLARAILPTAYTECVSGRLQP